MFDSVIGSLDRGLTVGERAMAAVDTDALVGDQPAQVLDRLAVAERRMAALRLAVTARAEDQHPWRRAGYSSYEEWLAAQQGTSKGRARRRAATARKVRDRPATADALGKGEISEDQAETIADAADKNPDAERNLLGTAKNPGTSQRDLEDEAAAAKAAVEDDADRARRLRRDRSAGWRRDRDGHWRLWAKLEPQVGAEAQRRLEALRNRIFAAHRAAADHERQDRYNADAVARLLTGEPDPALGADDAAPRRASAHDRIPAGSSGPGPMKPTPKEVVIVVDLAALRRGRVLSGETCEIRGVGPVPVEIAIEWLGDAFIKAIICDGSDIKMVEHFGRNCPAALKTALEYRDPRCVVPGCDNPFQEWDHRVRHEHQGPMSLENIRGPCTAHHRQITHDGYRLDGEPGRWRWVGPDGDVLRADDPADLPQQSQGS